MTPTKPEDQGPQRFHRRGDESIESDHRFLRAALDWLRAATGEGSIVVLLEDLDKYLQGHFEAEEMKGGFFDSVLHDTPRHAHRIEELRAEHVTIAELINKALGGLAPPYGVASDELRSQVGAIAEMLSQHERKENAMLQDSLESDIGPSD
jgi:hypothetical protein